MKSEKDKLAAKSVNALKAAAKRIGANVVDPKTGKAKTKQQLINGIVIKNRLAGKSMGANHTGTAKKPAVKKTMAKKPATMLGDNFKYRYISADTWRKTNKDSKTVINGVKYKLFLDESRGTILAPVKIKKES